jgi:hypothetical protein
LYRKCLSDHNHDERLPPPQAITELATLVQAFDADRIAGCADRTGLRIFLDELPPTGKTATADVQHVHSVAEE